MPSQNLISSLYGNNLNDVWIVDKQNHPIERELQSKISEFAAHGISPNLHIAHVTYGLYMAVLHGYVLSNKFSRLSFEGLARDTVNMMLSNLPDSVTEIGMDDLIAATQKLAFNILKKWIDKGRNIKIVIGDKLQANAAINFEQLNAIVAKRIASTSTSTAMMMTSMPGPLVVNGYAQVSNKRKFDSFAGDGPLDKRITLALCQSRMERAEAENAALREQLRSARIEIEELKGIHQRGLPPVVYPQIATDDEISKICGSSSSEVSCASSPLPSLRSTSSEESVVAYPAVMPRLWQPRIFHAQVASAIKATTSAFDNDPMAFPPPVPEDEEKQRECSFLL